MGQRQHGMLCTVIKTRDGSEKTLIKVLRPRWSSLLIPDNFDMVCEPFFPRHNINSGLTVRSLRGQVKTFMRENRPETIFYFGIAHWIWHTEFSNICF